MDIGKREKSQKSEKRRGWRNQIIISGMFILLVVLLFASFTLGRYNVEIKDLFLYMGKTLGMNLEIDPMVMSRFMKYIKLLKTG